MSGCDAPVETLFQTLAFNGTTSPHTPFTPLLSASKTKLLADLCRCEGVLHILLVAEYKQRHPGKLLLGEHCEKFGAGGVYAVSVGGVDDIDDRGGVRKVTSPIRPRGAHFSKAMDSNCVDREKVMVAEGKRTVYLIARQGPILGT